MTKKLCTYASCNAIVNHKDDGSSPRCSKHQRTYQKESKEDRQRKYAHHYDEKGRNIYHTTRWKKLRALKVGINPLCENCERFNIAKAVQEVDHVHEIEDGGEIWDIDNLQSLCKRCHLAKTLRAKADRERIVDAYGYFLKKS